MSASRTPMDGQDTVFDIREMLWRGRKYRWLIILPIVIAFCAALIYLKVAIPVYESFAVVSVADRPQVSSALEPLLRPDRDRETPREMIAVLDSRVHSRAFLTQLADRMHLAEQPALLAAARQAVRNVPGVTPEEYAMRIVVHRLGRKIRIVPITGSLVRIIASDPDPHFARSLANTIANVLIEDSKRTSLERVHARGDFSSDQIAVYEERLHKSENNLRAFQESVIRRKLTPSPITGNTAEKIPAVLRTIEEETAQVRSRLEAAYAEWDRAAGRAATPPDLSSSRIQELESRLGGLEVTLAIAWMKGAEGNAEASNLAARVGSLRQEILSAYEARAAERSDLVPAARDIAVGIAVDRSILRSLQIKRQRFLNLTNEYARAVQSTPREEMELQRLQEEVRTNRDLLMALRREATSSRLTEALEVSALGLGLAVVEAPQLPLNPSSPKPIRVFGAALLLGPLAAVGLVLGLERLVITIRTVEQAEAELGVPVIGTVSRIEGWNRPGTYLQRNWAGLSIVLVLLLTGVFFTLRATVLADRPSSGPTAGSTR